jgi:hypothetical protein
MLFLTPSTISSKRAWEDVADINIQARRTAVKESRTNLISAPAFIRLRQNTLQLVAGMNGETTHGEARQSEDGLATP